MMLYALELTPRQSKRVLEQAVRAHSMLEIEPRTACDDFTLHGSLRSVDGNLLSVDLAENGADVPSTQLVGAFCDVRTILSDHVYLFNTCILDVHDSVMPRRLILAMPSALQVGNRRRFVRRTLARSSGVELSAEELAESCCGDLCNISGNGLACRMPMPLDDVLYVGDPVRLRFELPGLRHVFDLSAVVCNKMPTGERDGIIVGLQFDLSEGEQEETRAVERLRAFLSDLATPIAAPESEA